MKLMRLLHIVWALGFVACSDSPTGPKTVQPSLSVMAPEVGPESAMVHVIANTPVMWHVDYGLTPAFGDSTPEVGPTATLNQNLPNLRALTHYYFQAVARLGTLEVAIGGDFTTPDYDVCDSRNTTAKIVPISISWTSSTPPSTNTVYVLDEVDLRDCTGNALTTGSTEFFSGAAPATWQMRANYGSKPHWFGAIRFLNGIWFDGWADASEIRINGVQPTQATDSMPPNWACRVDVGCVPGPRWKFWVDSLDVVHP